MTTGKSLCGGGVEEIAPTDASATGFSAEQAQVFLEGRWEMQVDIESSVARTGRADASFELTPLPGTTWRVEDWVASPVGCHDGPMLRVPMYMTFNLEDGQVLAEGEVSLDVEALSLEYVWFAEGEGSGGLAAEISPELEEAFVEARPHVVGYTGFGMGLWWGLAEGYFGVGPTVPEGVPDDGVLIAAFDTIPR